MGRFRYFITGTILGLCIVIPAIVLTLVNTAKIQSSSSALFSILASKTATSSGALSSNNSSSSSLLDATIEASSSATATDSAIYDPNKFAAQYFNNPYLSGDAVLFRYDPEINFTWDKSSPGQWVPEDNFSVRWTRTISLPDGLYRFKTETDDGVRLYVNGNLVINNFEDKPLTLLTADIPIATGSHNLVMEYVEESGDATAKLSYERIGERTDTGFVAEYFNNETWSGSPIVTRTEGNLSLFWGNGSPDPRVPSDHFSARYTKTDQFDEGTYRITIKADDNATLAVDDQQIPLHPIDLGYMAELPFKKGEHTITVMYSEHTGDASVMMTYTKLDGIEQSSFESEFFNNQTLSGLPVHQRIEPTVDFDWKSNSPNPSVVPDDHFSARFTTKRSLANGTYRFHIAADDGYKLIVDGITRLSAWDTSKKTTATTDIELTEGIHIIVVEYFENTGVASIKMNVERLGDVSDPEYTVQYFNNPILSGVAVSKTKTALIAYDWKDGSPQSEIPADNFSARFTKIMNFTGGQYRVTATADDGIRIYVDDQIILDHWYDSSPTTFTILPIISQGIHRIRIEYYEHLGDAQISVNFTPINKSFSHGFTGQYFANTNLAGVPAFTRTDDNISFDWGTLSPLVGLLPEDNFSVRWTKSELFEGGMYQFHARTDDGMRVRLDSTIVLDSWRDQEAATYSPILTIPAGDHTVTVEYYEKTGTAIAELDWRQITPTPTPNPYLLYDFYTPISSNGATNP